MHAPWPVRVARRMARALASAYPDPGRDAAAFDRDIDAFLDDDLHDAWHAHGWRGLVNTLRTLAADVARTRWRGMSLSVTTPSRHSPVRTHPRSTRMDGVIEDIRQSLRRLARTPGFTTVALVTLALGIGLTTAVFTVVDQSMLRPFSYPDIDRMVLLNERYGDNQLSVSWPNFVDWRQANTAFSEIGIYRGAAVTLTGHDQPERLTGSMVSASVFDSAGITPILGRRFSAADDQPGADRTAVISERLWRSHFNAASDVVGRVVTLSGEAYTIVGVMPAAMRFPSRLTDVWLSLGPIVPTLPTARDNHPGLAAVARLKPGVSLETARSAMEVVARQLALAHPDTNDKTHVTVRPYRDVIVQGIRPAFELLLGAVGLLLLIACANLASVMLARADGRRGELAVRAALGAGRWRLARHLITEAMVIAVIGGALGAFIAYWAVRAFVAMQPTTIPRIDLVTVDARVLAFALAVSILSALLFGTVPALRGSVVNWQGGLRNGRDGSRAGATGLRRALVVGEVAVAFTLLVGAGLLGRSLRSLLEIDLGFEPSRVVTMEIAIPRASYPSLDAWTSFHRALLERLPTGGAIQHVALTSNAPLSGNASESGLMREGDPPPTADHPPAEASYSVVSPDYFQVMGIQLVSGRTFAARDTRASLLVTVVDDVLAAKLFPNQSPIGRRIAFEGHGDSPATFVPIWREIIGVVHHVRQYGLTAEPPYLQLFAPVEQLPIWMQDRRPSLTLAVRTAGATDVVVADVRRAVHGLDPTIPVYGVQTMGDAIGQATEQPRLSLALVGVFAVLALVLAIVGVYGVLSQAVTERTREIGLRMALGAQRRDIGVLIARQATWLVVAGLAIGAGASLALASFVRSMLFNVSATDPTTIVCMAGILALTAGIAAAVPARRAAGVDPVTAIRTE